MAYILHFLLFDLKSSVLDKNCYNKYQCTLLTLQAVFKLRQDPRGGSTPYNGLYGEAPPERGTFFRLLVYKRVGISRAEVHERVGKSVI